MIYEGRKSEIARLARAQPWRRDVACSVAAVIDRFGRVQVPLRERKHRRSVVIVKSRERSETESAPQAPSKLSGVRPTQHDDDERPSREDRDYGSTIFTRPPVPLPRFLKGRKKPRQPD